MKTAYVTAAMAIALGTPGAGQTQTAPNSAATATAVEGTAYVIRADGRTEAEAWTGAKEQARSLGMLRTAPRGGKRPL